MVSLEFTQGISLASEFGKKRAAKEEANYEKGEREGGN